MVFEIKSNSTEGIIATIDAKNLSEGIQALIKANVDLSHAIFVGQDLSGGKYFDGLFQNADFRSTDLTNADFTGANLRGCKFDGAKTDGIVLDDALLENVKGLTVPKKPSQGEQIDTPSPTSTEDDSKRSKRSKRS